MKLELRFPFRDRRPPLQDLDDLEKFEALSGEAASSLPVGLLVNCRVVKVDGKFGLEARVDELGGLAAQIRREELGNRELADSRVEEAEIEKEFPLGSVHVAQLLSFDLTRFKVCKWGAGAGTSRIY